MRRPSHQGLSRYCLCISPSVKAPFARSITSLSVSSRPLNLFALSRKNQFARELITDRQQPVVPSLLLIILCIVQYAPAQDISNELHSYFEKIRTGTGANYPPTKQNSVQAGAQLILTLPFLSDSNRTVRAKACELVVHLAIRAADSIRQKGVNHLLNVCLESEAETTGVALYLLRKFTKDDFDEFSRNKIKSLFDSKPGFVIELVRLAGFLELVELKSKIRNYSLPGHRHALRWAALIALARLGDEQAIADVMLRVKRIPVNDDLIYNVFPDLIFTRQCLAFDYLIEVLNSPASNCQSADIERPIPIPCGYRVMELLAPVVEDFPFQPGAAGDLETDDYPGALEQTRHWFSTHPQYTIITKRY